MISSAKRLVEENNLSSLHITFCSKSFVSIAKKNNLLVREGIQYHWFNRGYKSFEDFLESLTHRKRKNITKEKKKIPYEDQTKNAYPPISNNSFINYWSLTFYFQSEQV